MARRKKKKTNNIFIFLLALFIVWAAHYIEENYYSWANPIPSYSMESVPEYNGYNYVIINDNEPVFLDSDYSSKSYESYSPLDGLGRCGVAIANIGVDLMPTEPRGSIGMIKPSGWHTVKYDVIEDKYLYNRCHLIGFQLTGENDNRENLITCTR